MKVLLERFRNWRRRGRLYRQALRESPECRLEAISAYPYGPDFDDCSRPECYAVGELVCYASHLANARYAELLEEAGL